MNAPRADMNPCCLCLPHHGSRSKTYVLGLFGELFDFDDHFFPVAGEDTAVATEDLVQFLVTCVD